MKKVPFSIIFLFLFVLPTSGQTFAAILYFSPNSGVFSPGQNLPVALRVNAEGESINAVTANFAYPADQLEIRSVAVNNNILPIVAEQSTDEGIVKIAGGNFTPFSGDQLLATVTFRVKADAAAGSLNFNPEATVVSAITNQNVLTGAELANFSSTSTDQMAEPTTLGLQNPQKEESIADLSQDNKINAQDLTLLLSKWGLKDPSSDLNKNGVVDIFDLSILLSDQKN